MNMFARPFSPVIYNFHTYVTENAALQNIGLGSYTRNSIDVFGKIRTNPESNQTIDSPEIVEYFGGDLNGTRSKLLGDIGTYAIIKYDKDNNQYIYVTGNEIFKTPSGDAATSLQNFQSKFDDWQKGFLTNSTEIVKMQLAWSNIQNSVSGCIHFINSFNILSCGSTSGSIRLYFHSSGRAKSGRGIALKGSPVIANVPRTVTGFAYSYGETQKTPPGVYVPSLADGINNPGNTVAGELGVFFDPSTGKYQSGTRQGLFRLLTDITGVAPKELPKDLESISLDRFYFGDLRIIPNVGSGLPLSIENNNPMLFGPNSMGGCEGPKEKVLLVNRTPRNFSAGEIVIASLIDGEWIPQGFGLPTSAAKKFGIEWSQVQKYIVDAKSLFRDMSDTKNVSPEQYIDHVRYRFYNSLPSMTQTVALAAARNDLTRVAILNLLNDDPKNYILGNDNKVILPINAISQAPDYNLKMNLIPSTGYKPFFDADVIKTTLGGNNTINILNWTNISKSPVYEDNIVSTEFTNFSWGMYFPDGYTSASVAKLKSLSGKAVKHRLPQKIYQDGTLNFVQASNDFFQIDDPYLYHMPAQFGLNSSGNPSLYLPYLWSDQLFGRQGNYADKLIQYMRFTTKGDFLEQDSASPVYNLKPSNPNKVQFTPVSLALALCSTEATNEQTAKLRAINGGLKNLLDQIKMDNIVYGTVEAPQVKDPDSTTLGQAFTRDSFKIKNFTFANVNDAKGYIGFGRNCLTSDGSKVELPNKLGISPDGGPGILPETVNSKEESNVVGIIGARATISLAAGGQLELRTNNNFGLGTYSVVRGNGGDVQVNILGSIGAWTQDNRGELKTDANVQWGSSSQEGDITAFGTTALYCQIYDHCPNTIYDATFMAPLQFHGPIKGLDNKDLDFDMPATMPKNNPNPNNVTKTLLNVGTIIGKDYSKNNSVNFTTIKNPIRRNMLLSGGGFSYIKQVAAAHMAGIKIIDKGVGYTDGELFAIGGTYPASGIVKTTDANGGILTVDFATEELGIEAYGEFNLTNGNPFEKNPIEATFPSTAGSGAKIVLESAKIIEKVVKDKVNVYNRSLLTPYDNNGGGSSGKGYITADKNTSYNLNMNTNGKYDIFFFFVNDILNYPNSMGGWTFSPNPIDSQYVNLEISAN